uniref:F-box associated domain-containing protein n=1 Tax=Arundo donax TaxID=35708 RepID=A0A0A9G009_ARUDO
MVFQSSCRRFNMRLLWGSIPMVLPSTEYCIAGAFVGNLYSSSAPWARRRRGASAPPLPSASLRKWLGKRSDATHLNEPFLFNGNLHSMLFLGRQSNILVFDTMDEVFRWLRVSFKIRLVASLPVVEHTLAMSNSHIESSDVEVDLWLLLDYKCAAWVHKYRIKLPVIDIRRFEDGGWCWHVLVDGFDWQLHYVISGNLLKKFQCNGHMLNFTTHILRESLIPHAFFIMQEDGGTHEPPFFWGM